MNYTRTDIDLMIAGSEYVCDGGGTLEIYTQGCSVHCSGCQNPETWDFNEGYRFSESRILNKIDEYTEIIKRVWILGGEPLQQDHKELEKLLYEIKIRNKEIWLFTSYELRDVPQQLMKMCDYIKTGTYSPEYGEGKTMYGVTMATANQKIHHIWKLAK